MIRCQNEGRQKKKRKTRSVESKMEQRHRQTEQDLRRGGVDCM
jgi:hypothetical protein